MSENLLEHPSGVKVTEYAGPELGFSWAGDPVSVDRRRYQITNDAGMLTTLGRAEMEALGEWFVREWSADCNCSCSNCSGCLDRPARP